MKRKNKILFLAPLLLIEISCTSNVRTDEAIAKVNGRVITVHDYQNLYDGLKPKELSRSGKEASEIKALVLKTLVRRWVVLSEAQKKNLSVSSAELDENIGRLKEGYTPEIFRESLLEHLVDEGEWREQIRQNLLITKIFDATELPKPAPKPQEALEFYEKNPALFHQKARAIALQIVVADKALAMDIRKRAAANPKSFLALAKQYSIGPEAQEDAKIEIERETLPAELDRALFDGPLNTTSQVIQSPYGFHILKVLERIPALNRDFELAKPEILKRLVQEQRTAGLARFEEDLIRSAHIEYNRPLIKRL